MLVENNLFHHVEQIQRVFVDGFKRHAKLINFVWHHKCPADIVVGQHFIAAKIPVEGWDFVSFLLVLEDAVHAEHDEFKIHTKYRLLCELCPMGSGALRAL